MKWGDRWKSGDKPPVRLVHKLCDHDADPRFVCGHCGEDLAAREVRAEPGPGLSSVAAQLPSDSSMSLACWAGSDPVDCPNTAWNTSVLSAADRPE